MILQTNTPYDCEIANLSFAFINIEWQLHKYMLA